MLQRNINEGARCCISCKRHPKEYHLYILKKLRITVENTQEKADP